jgi:hypothetical protein
VRGGDRSRRSPTRDGIRLAAVRHGRQVARLIAWLSQDKPNRSSNQREQHIDASIKTYKGKAGFLASTRKDVVCAASSWMSVTDAILGKLVQSH